jgi:translation initiation factor IF-2
LAVRIYALAKELKLDSKELVDLCTKTGIHGKGSALASLTDEEAEKVKQFIQGGGSKPKSTKTAQPMPKRPSDPMRTGKMPVIVTPKPPASPGVKPRSSADSEFAPSDERPLAASAEDVATMPEASQPGPLAGAMRREEYVGPGMAMGKVPNVATENKPSGKKRGDGTALGERPRPAVKLAPMPKATMPKGVSSAKEPPAQKPDMKLPPDLLGAGNLGSKPLASHLRRHEKTLETEREQRGVKHRRVEVVEEKPAVRGKPRRVKQVTEEKEDRPMLGGREQRQLQRRRNAQRGEGDEPSPRSANRRLRRTGTSTTAPRKDRVTVQLPCSVRELSEAAGVPAFEILRILLNAGIQTTITAVMDPEMTELVATELGINVEFKQAVSLEDQLLADLEEQEDDPADLVERAPVITFLGHVDHGKTSLLDRILGINVVSGESGGITQHIRAYTISRKGHPISFVDTPGHEAFTEMRARGANVTDIAVLVVAADDGVMPQTEEAISHARAAGVPIVVALNKIDLPGADVTRSMQGLSANELLPSEWGGDVEVVKTSAATGEGIDDLLDTVLTVAELHEFKANPNRPALGTCLESQQDPERGILAKVLVQNGTLRVGDVVVCGETFGRIKAMFDTLDNNVRLTEAGPSVPANVTGFHSAPNAGDRFYVLDDIGRAREIAEVRAEQNRSVALGSTGYRHVTLESLFERLESTEEVQTLNMILRADVRGSIEAIEKELSKLEHPEVRIKILQKSVGGITEADVTLADASDAVIIGFNVVPDEKARSRADATGVQIRRYEVIYKITDDLKKAVEGMLKPEERVVELGRALVQRTFKISKLGSVAGCRVISGTIERSGRARVIRDSTVVGDYPIETLRREKDDAREVREGYECGIKLAGFNDIKEGDLFEVYKIEEVNRSFDS